MSQYRIAVVIGSLCRESYNRQLAIAMKKLGPQDFSFHDLRIDDLPLYNAAWVRNSRNSPDWEREEGSRLVVQSS